MTQEKKKEKESEELPKKQKDISNAPLKRARNNMGMIGSSVIIL